MTYRLLWAPLALSIATAAMGCGSRSGLDRDAYVDADGGRGPGGPGPGGGGAGGGMGGGDEGGGGADGCVLERLGDAIGVAGGEGFHQRQPAIAFSNADETRVTIAMQWMVTEGPGFAPAELRHTSLSPWGDDWPSQDVGPSFLADFDGGVSFDLAPSEGDRFSLLFSLPAMNMGPPPPVRIIPAMIPASGDIPSPVNLAEPGRVLELARQPGLALAVFSQRQGMGGQRLVFVELSVDGDNATPTNQFVLGCGGAMGPQGILSAGAHALTANFETRWRAGFASAPLQTCASPSLEPPRDLILIDFSQSEAVYELPGTVPITQVRVVPDGEASLYAALDINGRIQLGRVDGAGFPAGGLTSLSIPAADPRGGFDVAPLEDGEAAVAFRAADTSEVTVVSLDASFTTVRAAVTTRPDSRRPRLIRSPEGDELLLAYQQDRVDGDRVVLTKLGCPR